MYSKIKNKILFIVHYLRYDIWRINGNDSTHIKTIFINITKAFLLTFRNINGSQINTRAAALTYNSLLSIVPLLAVLFAIARGFGFQNLVETQLFQYFTGQKIVLSKAMQFIDGSIDYAQGGVFLGIGIVILFYTVVTLLSSIEDNFNIIWRIKKGRTFSRQFTDYLALILIAPLFLICNAGLSIFLNSTANINIIGAVINPILKILPYIIIILLFTFLYIYIPNTKVKFSAAVLAGIVSGSCFQIFQMLYISGQFWIAKYNAIYGSFSALPLLMLWLQLSWFICLFGVQLSFSYQNVNKFSFEKDISNISRRYKDFILLMITTLIIKRFERGDKPYTADELSETFKIPTRLTNDSLYFLLQVGLLAETPLENDLVIAYIPAIDINHITLIYFLNKIDQYGSENFKIDIQGDIKNIWNKTLEIRTMIYEHEKNTLLKDL
ncbi:YihY/virulence factor BrkB family protein [Apibacter sp.]|uniref:YihY/virulence factor BrkB family protein n=1 Tax=Apibacter sp. TaxID=2023709 RepID=UPI0025D1268D|nr:YihY/virulence factor BrkB family protein [Apibacter sp.]MCT6868820.1 YihY/virulence factor BrkB family protein [Apibacter sp.]